jgi:DNA-binding NarL/FixJ family response regulator
LTQRRSPGNAAAALREAHGTSIELGADVLRADIEALAMQAHLSLEQPQPEALQENDAPLLADVTRREREVLGHLLAGRTYAEIAQALFISEKTVGAHVSHLLRKTHTSSRIQLAELARKVVPHDA